MSIGSKTDICNLTQGIIGNRNTISNIDTPTNDKEETYALWYDVTRRALLKKVVPSFAVGRRLISELVATIPFGYAHAFEYPRDCLKVLGLGNLSEKANFTYSIESNDTKRVIYTDDDWDDGLELRFIRDITDVNMMTPEFQLLLAEVLGGNVVLPITQDPVKAKLIRDALPMKMVEFSGINAQENTPIRISNSRFRESRFVQVSRNPTKK